MDKSYCSETESTITQLNNRGFKSQVRFLNWCRAEADHGPIAAEKGDMVDVNPVQTTFALAKVAVWLTAPKFLELWQQIIASHMAELETGMHDMVDPLSKDKKRTRAGMPAKVPYLTWAGEVPLDSCLGHTVVSGTEGWLLAGYAYLKLTPLVVLPTPGLGQTSPQYSWPFLRRCFPCVADLATRHWHRGFGDALRDEGRRRDLARNIRWSSGSWVACTSWLPCGHMTVLSCYKPEDEIEKTASGRKKKRKRSMWPLQCHSSSRCKALPWAYSMAQHAIHGFNIEACWARGKSAHVERSRCIDRKNP